MGVVGVGQVGEVAVVFDHGLLDQRVAEAHHQVVSRILRISRMHEAEGGTGMQACDGIQRFIRFNSRCGPVDFRTW